MTVAVVIPCPHCQRKLKIENPALLGKEVKCPGCKHPVLLQRPASDEEEVALELVTDDPPLGTSPRWIPDEPVIAPKFPEAKESTNGPMFPGPSSPTPKPIFPPAPEPASTSATTSQLSFEAASTAPTESAAATLKRLKKSRKRGQFVTYTVLGVLLLAGAGVIAFVVSKYEPPAPQSDDPQVAAMDPANAIPAADRPYNKGQLEGNVSLISEFNPTSGKPIELFMVPSGINFLIHLRPAELWSDQRQMQALRASLTEEVVSWLGEQLKAVCHREPQQIEEAMIGMILGAFGTKPEICAVVHLKESAKMSDLLEEFKGEYLYDIMEYPELRVKVDDQQGVLIRDDRTLAFCPANMAGELKEWINQPNFEVSEGMSQMLQASDRERLVTVMGNVADFRRHLEGLAPAASRPALTKILEWFGEDVETASWSIHTQPYFHSHVYLRPITTSTALRVDQRIKGQLEDLPQVLWKDLCIKMQPRELRFRNFIGRFPAMVEAFQRATVSVTGPKSVELTTVLPEIATYNLALGTLFTINEAARTDFAANTDVLIAQNSNKPKLPDTLKERMQLPVDAEFARKPLEMALQYLCDEVQVQLKVNGDALKDAGYTKNMPQTFNLGVVPMERALAEIINTYQEPGKVMVVSLDEKTMTVHVLTQKFAERDNMPIHEFPKP